MLILREFFDIFTIHFQPINLSGVLARLHVTTYWYPGGRDPELVGVNHLGYTSRVLPATFTHFPRAPATVKRKGIIMLSLAELKITIDICELHVAMKQGFSAHSIPSKFC